MDKISELPDELLVKILSSVPTKVAVSTSVLSKRWKFLWMWLSKLEYSDDEGNSFLVLRDFINKNLPLHRAPLIERLCLELWEEESTKVNHEEDIKLWVETAVSRCVRYLEVSYNVNMLPSSLFTCESLLILDSQGCSFYGLFSSISEDFATQKSDVRRCRLASEPSVYVSS